MKVLVRASARPFLLFLLFFLLFHRFWNHSVIFRDSFHLYAPLKFWVAAGWRSGELFGWNPWQFLGQPFAADVIAGWFYPLNILYALFPFELAHRLLILVHYPLAAIFMDLFLRGRGLERRAALIGGLAFALSGYMIQQHGMMVYLFGPAWAPLALFFFDRSLRDGFSWALAAAAVLALQVFAGEPQSAAITGSIILAWGTIAVRSRAGLRAALFGVSAVLLALGLAAVQILPARELMQESVRSQGVPLEEALYYSFHPLRLIELVWPSAFGAAGPEFSYWARFAIDAPEQVLPWSPSNYLGLPLLTLAVIGMIAGRRRWKWWVAAAAVFFLLLSLGRHAALYSLFHRFAPGFDAFRFPEKFMAWFTGAVAVLAALGLERLFSLFEKRPLAVVKGAWFWLALVLLGGAASGALLWGALNRSLAFNPPALAAARGDFINGALEWSLVNFSVGILVMLAAWKKLPVRLFFFALAAVLLVDWQVSNVRLMPAGPKEVYSPQSLVGRAIKRQGGPEPGRYRTFRRKIEPPAPALTEPSLSRLAGLRVWERASLRRNLHALEGFEDVVGYSASRPRLGDRLLHEELTPGALALFNVEFVISSLAAGNVRGLAGREVYRDEMNGLAVYQVERWPRAYWVPSVVTASSEAKAMLLLGEVDLLQTAILTTDEESEPGESSLRLIPASVIEYQPDLVRLRVTAPASGWLVLSDRFYPGWTASVDGSPTPVYIANVLTRAVRVPAGSRLVEFRFESKPLRTGALISSWCWFFWVGFFAVRWIRRGFKA